MNNDGNVIADNNQAQADNKASVKYAAAANDKTSTIRRKEKPAEETRWSFALVIIGIAPFILCAITYKTRSVLEKLGLAESLAKSETFGNIIGYLTLLYIFIGGILGIVFGALGLKDISAHPGLQGGGRCWLGILIGSMALMVIAIGVICKFS